MASDNSEAKSSKVDYQTLDVEEADPSTPMLRKQPRTIGTRLKAAFGSYGFGPDKAVPSGNELKDVGLRSLAEMYGTFLFVLFGCSAVCGGAILGLEIGVWQVAIVWGLGLAISIYLTVGISGGHLNPAVTLAMTVIRNDDFPMSNLAPYILAQLIGAFLAGLMTWGVYEPFIARFERIHNITRGQPGSHLTAGIFGGYFPNPGAFPLEDDATELLVTPARAFAVEVLGTLILVLVIFVLTSKEYRALGEVKAGAPILIGLTLAVLICEYGVITECALNPARDFGPRLAATFAGWGRVALPGPRNGFWVYLTAPMLGGLLGGLIGEFGFVRTLARFNKKADDEKND